MYFVDNKSVETHVLLDPETHSVVVEVYMDDKEDPFTVICASPRDLVTEMLNSGEYDDDVLDAFLDTLYETVAILEDYLNAEAEEE